MMGLKHSDNSSGVDVPFETIEDLISRRGIESKDPTGHNKHILTNCIERSLLLLSATYHEDKHMDGDKVMAITQSIEKLLNIRKQFITDYFTEHPVTIEKEDL